MIFFRKILGTPLRFFGFLGIMLFILTALWRWETGIFQGYYWYSNLSPIGFILASILLYTIAYSTNDLLSENTFLSRLLGSPLKILAFLLILQGVFIAVYLIGYIHFESGFIWIILSGIFLYGIDFLFSKERMGTRTFWVVQLSTVLLVIVIYFLFSLVA